jgi:multicomponent Na+:H+ antiporter subunit E
MRSRIILFILGFFVWCLLNWRPDEQEILVGVIACGLVSYLSGHLFATRPYFFKRFYRYFWFLYYIPLFFWECIKANIDVALRVIHPHKPLKPGIVRIRTSLKSDAALTFLANSITLTPGTLTIDIDKEKGILYIHWIDVKDKDIEKATEIIAGKFETVLKRIFE